MKLTIPGHETASRGTSAHGTFPRRRPAAAYVR